MEIRPPDMNSEFNFYQFSATPNLDCDLSLPVCFGSDMAFFAGMHISELAYCKPNKDYMGMAENAIYAGDYKYVQITNDLDSIFYKGDCFRLRLNSMGTYYYSNLLRYVGQNVEGTSLLEYRCNEAQFGFDYTIAGNNKVRLPIRIFNPQFPQADKVYIKSNGERSVQFSKIDKEWKLETEYLTAELHEKIIVALAHDTVIIDGESVTKSSEYEIGWEEYVEYDCSGRLSKATCKVQQNRTLRNSNCR